MAKKIPTPNEIMEFIKIFNQECDKELIKGEYVTPQQRESIETRGKFLALVGKENYHTVASKIATELKHYNLAMENRIAWAVHNNDKGVISIIKKIKKLRKVLQYPTENDIKFAKKLGGFQEKKMNKYLKLLSMLDTIVQDFEKIEDLRMWTILYTDYLCTPYKKSKTSLKKTINNILKKYKIQGYSKEAKNLIDHIDDFPD